MQKKFIILFFTLLFNSATFASSTVEEVNSFIKNMMHQTFSILNNSQMSDQEKNQESKKLLDQTLDCKWMGNFVLGQHKRLISPEEKIEFLSAYKNFVLSYLSKNFASMKGASFEVKNTKQTGDSEYLVTCESMKPGDQEKNEMQIMMRQNADGKLVVIDMIVANVSFVASQRSEYGGIISEKGVNFMIEHLKSTDKVSSFEQKNKVEIYTADYCPYCKTAKEFLTQHNIRFEEIDITHNQEARQHIAKMSIIKTVPQIFVNGQFVSDCSGLTKIKAEGRLQEVFFGS